MLKWANDFLEQCLSNIPEGKYSDRLRGELENHLTSLAQDLTEAGYSDIEAQAEAIRQMGDPAELNRSYRESWLRQPERVGHDCMVCFLSSLLAGACYIFAFMALIICLSAYQAIYPYEFRPVLENISAAKALFGAGLFLCTYLMNAILLRNEFRGRRDRRSLITIGLLMTWVEEKAMVMLLTAMVYHGVYGTTSFTLPELVRLASHSGGQTAPWFTTFYIIWTFFGCLLLGWLFGCGKRDEKRLPDRKLAR